MTEKDIFKNGSTTYFWSSAFFPMQVRKDVFKLYSFVRVADDYVDQIPPDVATFKQLKKMYQNSKPPTGNSLNAQVVRNIKYLEKKYNFDKKWAKTFLIAMESDTRQVSYNSLNDSLGYTYGSAEVIGLMMARVMGLSDKSHNYAKLQGRAMQWINFIRDVEEDNQLGRCYFPREDLIKFGLKDLSKKSAYANKQEFSDFMRYQIQRYKDWQTQSQAGYRFISRRLRIPLLTAASMYNWTARQIENDPLAVFSKKIKPTKRKVILAAAKNIINA